jgi:hypothetical protein
MIAFAPPDEDIMIDYILLDEVENAQVMEVNGEQMSGITANSSNRNEVQYEGQFPFIIKTTQEGRNGGREYYLSAGSAEMCQKVVHDLNRSSHIAKFRAETHSRLKKSQFAVRQIYVSSPFLYTSAILIAAVRALRNGALDLPGCSLLCTGKSMCLLSHCTQLRSLSLLSPPFSFNSPQTRRGSPTPTPPELRHERLRRAVRAAPQAGRRLAHPARQPQR